MIRPSAEESKLHGACPQLFFPAEPNENVVLPSQECNAKVEWKSDSPPEKQGRCRRLGLLSRSITTALCIAALESSAAAQSFPTWANGTVDYVTSVPSGILFRFAGNFVPGNCSGTPYGFMLIPQANQSMTALFLSRIAAGQKSFTIYSDATPAGSYCVINQVAVGAI
jgi:hypothetical protein